MSAAPAPNAAAHAGEECGRCGGERIADVLCAECTAVLEAEIAASGRMGYCPLCRKPVRMDGGRMAGHDRYCSRFCESANGLALGALDEEPRA